MPCTSKFVECLFHRKPKGSNRSPSEGNNSNIVNYNDQFEPLFREAASQENRSVLNIYSEEIRSALGIDYFSQKIGHGSFGEVYLGVYKEVPYALKVQSWKHNQDQVQWQRKAETEIQMLIDLEHENVVDILGYAFVGPDDDYEHLIIKFEYLNTSLEKYLDRCLDGLSLHENIQLAMQLSSAIDFMHQKGVVHHDIKPSNIMFHADMRKPRGSRAEDVTFKIIDLGSANSYEKGELDHSKHFKGTEYYMAPEKRVRMVYDPKLSDSYSVGVTLLESLLGIQKLSNRLRMFHTYAAVCDNYLQVLKANHASPIKIKYADLIGTLLTEDPSVRSSLDYFNVHVGRLDV